MGHRCHYFCLLKGRHSEGPHEMQACSQKCSWGWVMQGWDGWVIKGWGEPCRVGLDRVGWDVVGHAGVGWGIGFIIFVH